jgi:glucose/arabinose dehydrogenase
MRLKKTLVVGAAALAAVGTVAVASKLPNLASASESVAADTAAPTAPKGLKSTGSTATSVALSWTAATDNVGVAGYDIYHDGNKYTEVAGEKVTANVTGLKPKTAYRFTVFARDAAGNVSTASNAAAVTTPESADKTAPTAPKNLAVTATTVNSVSLKWSASTDNVGVAGYDVYNGGTVLAADVTGTSTTVKNLVSNTSYTFTVKAKDAATNASPASNQVTAKTKAGQGGSSTPSTITTVASGLTIPWGIDWLPDGNALVGERDSFDVYKVTQSGQKAKVGKVPNVVTTDGEGGLLGVAVSPTFASDKLIFVYHTAAAGNQIVKMTFDGTKLGAPKTILTGIKKNRFHNGGRLKFGPDGFLYATTGDAQQPNLAQDRNSINGKILRMTTDGKAAPGNPFGTVVYSIGHRNPQGLAWDSAGRLWAAEFGNSKFDELNLIEGGKNYGWPTCEGNCSTDGMTNPKRQWSVGEASPSGIAIVDGAVYMAALRGQRLWRIPLNGTGTGSPEAYYVNQYGRLRTVEKIPGKNQFWVTTTNSDNNGGKPDGSDKIFRVEVK